MFDPKTKEIICNFLIRNHIKMTTEQLTNAILRLLLIDISEKTVTRFLEETMGDQHSRKRGRPRKLG